VTEQQDDITVVLRECEKTLRRLSAEGRLAEAGLAAFVELSRKIQREMERRSQADRRAVPRSEPERRRMEGETRAEEISLS
jgi:hypothetical protein